MLALEDHLRSIFPVGMVGRVTRIVGMTVSVSGFPAPLGSLARLENEHESFLEAEVIGFAGDETLMLPYGDLSGVRPGTRVVLGKSIQIARVGEGLLGRVINGRGRFIDERASAILPRHVRLQSPPIPPLHRPRLHEILPTGLRAIDGLLTCAKGQRLGIFSGSGIGKSTLLGQIARSSAADVNVVVLIGERGREVREFIERDLGPEGAARSVVVVATGDDPAVLRLRAAYLGTAIAEFFRDTGRDVLLVMDSVSRFALAYREIALSAGEPPASRGYPPSVFSSLARLLERSGCTEAGSITGFYTVLVEGDDHNEPIADAVRGTLDGHVVLSRKLAEQGHFPAIDILSSVSRLMPVIASQEHRRAGTSLRQLLSAHQQAADLISIGAYQSGSNPDVDAALNLQASIQGFLQQSPQEQSSLEETLQRLQALVSLRCHPDESSEISSAVEWEQRVAE